MRSNFILEIVIRRKSHFNVLSTSPHLRRRPDFRHHYSLRHQMNSDRILLHFRRHSRDFQYLVDMVARRNI